MSSRIIPITRALCSASRLSSRVASCLPHVHRQYSPQIAPFTTSFPQYSSLNQASETLDVKPAEEQLDDEVDKLFKYVEIEVRGHDPAVLRSYKWYALETARHLDIKVAKTWEPKKVHKRLTTLKSAFAKKKYLVQYEARTYFQVMQFQHLTGSTADTFLEYVQRNLPEGVAMKVTKTQIEQPPEYVKPPVQIEDHSVNQ
ncbi:small ribosomal subunit protein uS10m-like [Ornithodoros turicata]|uniref:small ribosomal subunit protein uS10m-like n=1 Tax=Ornithodoros turicata TaxID=34597 RepID=UPI00313961F0